MRFEFATATRILFGPGTLSQAGQVAASCGTRALIVTGRDPKRAERLGSILTGSSITSVVHPVASEPNMETVEAGVQLARQYKCDLVAAIGGGSALDAGKAIAAMLANPGSLLDYLEVIGGAHPLPFPSVPFLAIPTTAGSGSEVTRNAVLVSKAHRVKVSLRGPSLLPRAAIVDPDLTRDLPPPLTAATGLDALTQLIEPYLSCRSNPLIDALCLEGMSRVARSLSRAFADGRNAAAREDLALASLLGGIALANAGLGAVHGLAGPLGGMFSAPHGAVCAALLPHALDANLTAVRSEVVRNELLNSADRRLREGVNDHELLGKFDRIAQTVTAHPQAGAEEGIVWIRMLAAEFAIPPLRSYGIQREHFDDIASKAAQASSMKANPVALTPREVVGILEAAW